MGSSVDFNKLLGSFQWWLKVNIYIYIYTCNEITMLQAIPIKKGLLDWYINIGTSYNIDYAKEYLGLSMTTVVLVNFVQEQASESCFVILFAQSTCSNIYIYQYYERLA